MVFLTPFILSFLLNSYRKAKFVIERSISITKDIPALHTMLWMGSYKFDKEKHSTCSGLEKHEWTWKTVNIMMLGFIAHSCVEIAFLHKSTHNKLSVE